MSWQGPARLFEGASYETLYDLEMGPEGAEDAADEYIRSLLPVLVQWREQLVKKRTQFRGLPESDYRRKYEGWLREESDAYQRALLKLSEAWLAYFFAYEGSGVPTSLIFELDGGVK